MVFSEAGQPEMTDEEKLAAIAQQYAVLNNRTSGMEIKWVVEMRIHGMITARDGMQAGVMYFLKYMYHTS